MKISKVILACTNDHYYDYYEVVSKAWKSSNILVTLVSLQFQTQFKRQFHVGNFALALISSMLRIQRPCAIQPPMQLAMQ